mgnify:CR=1 FL=1
MESVNVGSVAVFKDLDASKAQALKPLEEAAEVFGAWQRLNEELVFYDRTDEDPSGTVQAFRKGCDRRPHRRVRRCHTGDA